MEQENLNLILGALDSLGVALAEHDHQWTEGERAIYEKAVEIVQSRAAQSSEIDPVSGYRYDQEIPKPICEMQQISAAHASECPVCHKADKVDADVQDGKRYCHRCEQSFA